MHVVGIDVSLTATGIAHIRVDDLDGLTVETFTIKSKPSDPSIESRLERLRTVAYEAAQAAARADLVVIEAPALSRNTGHVWDRAGLWWLILDFIDNDWQVPVVQITPTQLKKFATGRGTADKTAVAVAMTRLWDDAPASNDNEFDALALATLGAIRLTSNLPFTVLERHAAAVAAVDWPTGVAA